MLPYAIKIHCNANSSGASAVHWQMLTCEETSNNSHMDTYAQMHRDAFSNLLFTTSHFKSLHSQVKPFSAMKSLQT